MYSTLFARSFSRYEQKRLGYGAIVGSLAMVLSIWIVLKPYLSLLSLRLSMDNTGLEMLMTNDTNLSWQLESETKEIKQICNVFDPRSDFCQIDGDIRVHGNSSSISIASFHIGILEKTSSWSIKPYARKESAAAMDLVKNWSVNLVSSRKEIPLCDINHSVPAIIFSLGGFSGNHFHDFSDLVIPLYVTSQQFNRSVQFLVTDNRPWWINKFQGILKQLSRYKTIDIDREGKTHCFPRVIVGLKSHKELSIDTSKSPNGLSMEDFRHFLRNTYSLKRTKAIKLTDADDQRPRLLIISRRNSRSFTNTGKISQMARNLGFDVVVAEANLSTDLSRFAQIVNSCDVLMGVHGAGLTNMVFLPGNAILIQIVPLGGLDGLARDDFGEPAKDMNLRYLLYKIKMKESTLIKQYQLDHVIFRDPSSVHKQGWDAVRSTYLEKQNVKLDVHRFRATLLKALELLHQ